MAVGWPDHLVHQVHTRDTLSDGVLHLHNKALFRIQIQEFVQYKRDVNKF